MAIATRPLRSRALREPASTRAGAAGRRCGRQRGRGRQRGGGRRRHGRRRRGLRARWRRLRGPCRSQQLGPEQPGDDAEPECQHEQEQREGDPVGVAVGRCLGRRRAGAVAGGGASTGSVVSGGGVVSVLRSRGLVGSGLLSLRAVSTASVELVDTAVGREAVLELEPLGCGTRARAEEAVDRTRSIAELHESSLHFADSLRSHPGGCIRSGSRRGRLPALRPLHVDDAQAGARVLDRSPVPAGGGHRLRLARAACVGTGMTSSPISASANARAGGPSRDRCAAFMSCISSPTNRAFSIALGGARRRARPARACYLRGGG